MNSSNDPIDPRLRQLDYRRLTLLEKVSCQPGITSNQLAAQLGLSKGQAGPLTRALVLQELLTFARGPASNRHYYHLNETVKRADILRALALAREPSDDELAYNAPLDDMDKALNILGQYLSDMSRLSVGAAEQIKALRRQR